MEKICTLCPRKCKVDRNLDEKGFCGAGGKIKIAREALHFWEEPCISGKNGSGTVFFSGCNMKCTFCQNYAISTLNKGYEITVEELSDIFIRLKNKNAHNINLVTPTHFTDKIIKAIDIAKGKGLNIPVIYNSGGYESVEALRKLLGYIDIYIPDMKYFDNKYSVEYSSANDYFNISKAAIEEMYRQVGKCQFDENGIMIKGVIVRHLMLPGLLFDSKKIIDYLYNKYGKSIYISLMSQYTPMPRCRDIPKLNMKLSKKHYQTMVEYCMEKGMENVFIQDGDSADESFIPEFYDEKY